MATAPVSRRLNLTRDQLATFLTDQQQIRQFELLFATVDQIQTITGTDFEYQADSAAASANEALAQINALAQATAVNDAALNAKVQQALDAIPQLAQTLDLLATAPIKPDPRISQLADVYAPSPANADLLIYDGTQQRWESTASPYISNSFETVSKNLKASDAAFTYDMSGNLVTITYANGIVKTLNYTLGILTSIVLSGSIPSGILTTKTLTYDMSGNLTNITYS
jgi:YD repeat-containing protein